MTIKPGAFRFNTDSMKLEIFRGSANYEGTASMAGIGTLAAGQWEEIQARSPEVQTGGTRGLFGGGSSPTNVIDYVNISSTGDAQDFGDLSTDNVNLASCSNSTRGVFGGGLVSPLSPYYTNVIQYITISSTGDAQDFGDLSTDKGNLASCSNSTRGVFGGGFTFTPVSTNLNTIEYITISSTGDAIDFGDLSIDKNTLGACSNSTRGVFGGGFVAPNSLNTIEYITISSAGNASDFGDLSVGKNGLCACSNSTRGVFGGGGNPTPVSTIEYITISSAGNASDFGDLSVGKNSLCACSSSTRGVFGGGFFTPSTTDVIEYVNIMSTGNAVDFGDLTIGRSNAGGLSNGHGGL